jgi:hypothetical protein
MGEKPGTLNLTSGDKNVDLYFDSGNIIYAASNQVMYRLSSLLLRKNKIDASVHKRLEEIMLQQKSKFGQIAVEQKVLTEEDLRKFLKIQAAEIFYSCFPWTDGNFTFHDTLQLPAYAVTISMDHQNLIMEAARRIDDENYFAKNLPAEGSVFRTVGDPAGWERIHLTLDEWKVLFLIDGKRTVEQVCKESSANRQDVYRALYGFYANHLIEVIPELRMHSEDGKRPLSGSITIKQKPDTKLLISSTARLTSKDVLKITLARLTWKKRDSDKKTFPLIEQEYFVGRQMGNQIHIADPSISNVHARIFKGPEGYVIEDLNSRNGTFVNGTRIDRKLLHENDSVRIGNSNFVYNIVFEVKQLPPSGDSRP